jgi:hypothetical protein
MAIRNEKSELKKEVEDRLLSLDNDWELFWDDSSNAIKQIV